MADEATTDTQETPQVSEEQQQTNDADVFYKAEGQEKDSEKEAEAKGDEEKPAEADKSDDEKSKEESSEADKETDKDKAGDGEIKLEVAEDSPLTKDQVDQVLDFAKENKLSQDQAEKLLSMKEDAVDSLLEAQEDALAKEKEKWAEELASDPEIGGDNKKEASENARRVVERFGTDKFKQLMNDTGYGNYPELVRVFSRIGKEMAEDKFFKASTTVSKEKPLEDYFYGGDNKS